LINPDGASLAAALSSRGDGPRINADVTEADEAYSIKSEVRGARRENIKVLIEGSVVSIRV